jgi:tRNA(Ile)-lysidine synthase
MLEELGAPVPRGEALGRLLATLEAGGTATLGGVRCAGGEPWRFAPAPPRRR